jgi:hypothetical protein
MARAISSSDRSSYSARIRTSRCNGGKERTAFPTFCVRRKLSGILTLSHNDGYP